MKSLLNISVFASAVLSIFSTTLTIYEVPTIKESLSVLKEDNVDQKSGSEKEIMRVYISFDSSKKDETHRDTVLVTRNSMSNSSTYKNQFSVFGIRMASNNNWSNIWLKK